MTTAVNILTWLTPEDFTTENTENTERNQYKVLLIPSSSGPICLDRSQLAQVAVYIDP